MTRILTALTLLLALTLSACEEEIDETTTLLPLAVGNTWQFDSDSDDAVWSIEVLEGAGLDGEVSYNYTLKVDGVPQYPHDLYLADDGWTEVDPDDEIPPLFLKLPAAEGATWEHEYIGQNSETYHTIEITGREDVSVPGGDFEGAWVVDRYRESDYGDYTSTQRIVDWYAPAHGLVQCAITNTDGEVTTLKLTDHQVAEEE